MFYKKNVAIILAGGSGSRFNKETPKQFFKLAGRLIIEYAIDAFEVSKKIDEIVVTVPQGYEEILHQLREKNNWKKISKVIPGGASRAASTAAALSCISNLSNDSKIIIHDAARPLLDQLTLERCIDALNYAPAVNVVMPAVDTIVQVDDLENVNSIPDRSHLRCGQTPQGFHYQTIRNTYEKADLNDLKGITCDCSLLKREFPEINISTVPGEYFNIKITNPIDLFIAEKLIQFKKFNTADNYIKKNIENKVIIILGGSSGIGASIASILRKYNAKVEIASRSFNNIDIRNTDITKKYLETVFKRHGAIDTIINTTGTLIRKKINDCTTEEIEEIISTNLISSINLAQLSYPFLKLSKGCLVNFSSSSYTRGRSMYATYSATKAAIVNFTQAIAEEWYEDGIRVLCISPERTRTPMRLNSFGEEPSQTLLNPEKVAYSTLSAITSSLTGIIVDVRLESNKSPFQNK